MGYNPLRSSNIEQMEPAEKAIYNAMQEVEKLGADKRLTDAVFHLQIAKKRVSDFIDYPIKKNEVDGGK